MRREHTLVGGSLRCRRVEATVEMDAVVDLERCGEDALGAVTGTLRGLVLSSGHIHAAGMQVVALHVVVEVVDGVLDVVFGLVPRQSVVGILATVFRHLHVADGVGLGGSGERQKKEEEKDKTQS